MSNLKNKFYSFIFIVVMLSYLLVGYYSITFKYCIFNTEFTGTSVFFSFCVIIAIVMTAAHLIQIEYAFDLYDLILGLMLCIFFYIYFLLFTKGILFRLLASMCTLFLVILIKRCPLKDYLLKKTHLIFIVLFFTLYIGDPLLFLSSIWICSNILIASTAIYSRVVEGIFADIKIINNHWSNDWDLVDIWRCIKLLLVVEIGVTVKIVMILVSLDNLLIYSEGGWLDNPQVADLKVWGALWFYIYIFINLILLVGNLHIIWYRNTPVRDKLVSTCFTCLKAGALVGGVTTWWCVGASYTSLADPTLIGNTYQIYCGRGYGFSTATAHQRHNYWMQCPDYREYPRMLTSDRIITNERIDEALEYRSNKRSVLKRLRHRPSVYNNYNQKWY